METQQDILTDIEESVWYQDASVGARFLNFIIDFICVIALVVLTLLFVFPEISEAGYQLLIYSTFLIYYSLLETATNGRTIGKFVTGTRAVRIDRAEFSGGNAILRSLCRLVPFDSISALGGSPWHDKWTKTRVVKVR